MVECYLHTVEVIGSSPVSSISGIERFDEALPAGRGMRRVHSGGVFP